MPALPWMHGPQAGTSAETIVLASRFKLTHYRDVAPFFLSALQIHAQVRRSAGAIGVALIAHPLRREFYTLSSWQDAASIDAMIATEPHRSVMTRYRSRTAAARFVTWRAAGPARPTWSEARRRLLDAAANE